MRHIQYQGETLPPFPLLAFHLVLHKFHIYTILSYSFSLILFMILPLFAGSTEKRRLKKQIVLWFTPHF